MKVLISSIGSRGEAQPILALALELRALGHDAALCVPPNFKPWVESRGIACIPVGPDVQKFVVQSASAGAKPKKATRAQMRQVVAHTVRDQFAVMREAAKGRDLIVVAGGLQSASAADHPAAIAARLPEPTAIAARPREQSALDSERAALERPVSRHGQRAARRARARPGRAVG